MRCHCRREARKKRELEDRERKIDEHEKQLEQDAKAAARAQARAKREAAEAKKARNEAAAEQRKEEEAREEEARSRELEKRVERQMAAFAGSEQPRKVHATHALAAQAGEGKATASGKEEESVQWKRAKEAAEKRKEAEERAHEQAEAARKAKKEKERKLWAAAEAERQKQQEKRARMEEQERRHKEERKEEFLQAARARRDEQRAEHAQVQPQQDSVAHSGLGTDRAEADDIERQVEALKNQLMDSANKKAAERRAMEKKEAEVCASLVEILMFVYVCGGTWDLVWASLSVLCGAHWRHLMGRGSETGTSRFPRSRHARRAAYTTCKRSASMSRRASTCTRQPPVRRLHQCQHRPQCLQAIPRGVI